MTDQSTVSMGSRGGTIGVEPFDTGYGGGFQVQAGHSGCHGVRAGGGSRTLSLRNVSESRSRADRIARESTMA